MVFSRSDDRFSSRAGRGLNAKSTMIDGAVKQEGSAHQVGSAKPLTSNISEIWAHSLSFWCQPEAGWDVAVLCSIGSFKGFQMPWA